MKSEYFASKNNAKGIFNSLIEESSVQVSALPTFIALFQL